MGRRMLINGRHAQYELRVALVEQNVLDDYHVQLAAAGLCRGNIYRGVVADIVPSLNAAFVDFGAERRGFLTIQDVVPQAYHRETSQTRPRIEEVLQKGQPLLVQVAADAIGQKGASLTTSISLAGRYLVLTPFDSQKGLSRKVEDESLRKKVREKAQGLKLPQGCGYILRTNAVGQVKAEITKDGNALLRAWRRVDEQWRKGSGPRLLYDDQDLLVRALRDYLDPAVEEVVIDDPELLRRAEEYVQTMMPRSKLQLVEYDRPLPLFSFHNLEPQIDGIYQRRVALPSGGSIVVDPTEALTAIDINSGRATGAETQAETAVNTNLEAAAAIAKQLRLRDIGGLIVVDFIDMRAQRDRRRVERALKEALKADRARNSIGRISNNGLLEINRQRLHQSAQQRTHSICGHCGGRGEVPGGSWAGLRLLRRIEARAATGVIQEMTVSVHPDLALAVLNERRRQLGALEKTFGVRIQIVPDAGVDLLSDRMECIKRSSSQSAWAGYVPPTERATAASDLVEVAKQAPTTPADGQEEESGEQARANSNGDSARSSARRRRRRGGKRRRSEAAATTAAVAGDSDSAAVQGDRANSTVAPVDSDVAQPQEGDGDGTATPAGAARSRRGRRGGRRGRRNNAARSEGGAGNSASSPTAVDAATEGSGSAASDEPRARPRASRRGGRRRRGSQTSAANDGPSGP